MIKALLSTLLALAPGLHAAETRRYEWDENWPRFRSSEYAVTGLAAAGAAVNFFVVPPPRMPVWRGPILFDHSARRALLARSEAGRERVKLLSNILTIPLITYSMLDGPITAGWVGGNKDTAMQLALINAETFAVTEVLNLTVSNLIPRTRPEGAVCDPDTPYDPYCTKSFWSGHTANVFAAASLVCVEHDALALYGGRKDAIACGASLATAATVGVLRVSANNHHASDVIIGAAIGGATGYLLPNFLHFRSKRSGPRLGYWIPSVHPGGGGLTFVRAW